ncbi:MAG: hypothetical protein ACRD24_07020 [Terriglobales bacterium]
MAVRIAAILTIAAATWFLVTWERAPPTPATADPAPGLAPTPPPRFGWSQLESRTFATYAGLFTPIPLPPHGKSKIRVRVSAEQPVIFGFAADEAEFRRFLQGGASICASSDVIEVAQDCHVAPGAILFVADSRREGTLLLATIAALLREGEPVARASKPNKVTVTVVEWKCIANCPPPASPRRKSDRQ